MRFGNSALVIRLALAIASASLIAGFAPEAQGQTKAKTPGQDIAALQQLVKQGRLQEARQLGKVLTARYPNRADLRTWYAQRLVESGKTQEAVLQYQQAHKLEPKEIEPLLALSDIYLENLDVRNAIMYARKASAVKPDNMQVQLALLSALIQGDQLAEAEHQVSDLLQKNNNDPELLMLAYQLKSKKGDLIQARFFLEKAVNNCPAKVQWALQLSDLLDNSGRHQEARECLRNILQSHPENTAARLRLARNLEFFAQDYNAAIAQYELVLKEDKTEPSALTGIERCHAKKNNIALRLKNAIRGALFKLGN